MNISQFMLERTFGSHLVQFLLKGRLLQTLIYWKLWSVGWGGSIYNRSQLPREDVSLTDQVSSVTSLVGKVSQLLDCKMNWNNTLQPLDSAIADYSWLLLRYRRTFKQKQWIVQKLTFYIKFWSMLYFLHSQEYLMLYEKSALGKHLQAWRTASLLGFLLTHVLISTPTQLLW